MTTFTPGTAEETLEAVRWAVSEESPLEILGHGSKRGIGRPLQTGHVLDLSSSVNGRTHEGFLRTIAAAMGVASPPGFGMFPNAPLITELKQ